MPSPVPKNTRIFLYNIYIEGDECSKIDWSPIPVSPNNTDIEYLLAENVRTKVDRLMTTAWNLKNIYLASHPRSNNQNWILSLEAAMRFADTLFPPEEEREWRK